MARGIKRGVVVASILVFLLLVFLPVMGGLDRPGQNALAVFVLCFALWGTAVVPLAVTGLLVLALLPLLGVLESQEAFALFGNQAVFFIVGALILAAGIMKSGLSKRLALRILVLFGRTPGGLLAGILLTSAFLSFWMPEHAAAAMMFPIVLEVAGSLRLRPQRSVYGKALFLAMAWGAIIGGIGTLLGGARNPLAIGMLYEEYAIRIGFFQWMTASMPLVAFLLGVAYLLLRVFFPMDVQTVRGALDRLRSDISAMGAIGGQEAKVAGIALTTVSLWITAGHRLGLASISLLSAFALFALRTVTWREVEQYVNWGIMLMYGGAIALGSALVQTGAVTWMADRLLVPLGASPGMFVLVLSLIALILTEGISNAATVALLLPMGFGFAQASGLSPVIVMYAIALPAGLAFCLPMGTPPNAIAFSSGYYRILDAIKGGVLLNLIAWVAFLILSKWYWPLIGLQY